MKTTKSVFFVCFFLENVGIKKIITELYVVYCATFALSGYLEYLLHCCIKYSDIKVLNTFMS